MIITNADGAPRRYAKELTTTGVLTLIAANDRIGRRLEAMSISSGATGASITLTLTTALGDFNILNAVPIAANSTEFIKDFPLPIQKNEVLKVQASAGNILTVVAIVMDMVPKEDDRRSIVPRTGLPAGAVR